MNDDTFKVLWIATLICLLEGFAMHCGYNGTTLRLTIAALAGLAGYELNRVIRALRGEDDEPDSE